MHVSIEFYFPIENVKKIWVKAMGGCIAIFQHQMGKSGLRWGMKKEMQRCIPRQFIKTTDLPENGQLEYTWVVRKRL